MIRIEDLIDEAERTARLYAEMPVDQLRQLQQAHQLDQAAATKPLSIMFGGGRLALIAAELQKRKEPAG